MPLIRRDGTCSSEVVLATPKGMDTLKSNIYNSTESKSREYVGCVPQEDVMKESTPHSHLTKPVDIFDSMVHSIKYAMLTN